MPPVRRSNDIRRRAFSSVMPKKSERSHEENQERAYVAASRRSDRSIEARVESARRASDIHKQRTGRGLKVTEEDVRNEEMYEEEEDDPSTCYQHFMRSGPPTLTAQQVASNMSDWFSGYAATSTTIAAYNSALRGASPAPYQNVEFANSQTPRMLQEQQQQQSGQAQTQSQKPTSQTQHQSQPQNRHIRPYSRPLSNASTGPKLQTGRSMSLDVRADMMSTLTSTPGQENLQSNGSSEEGWARRQSMPSQWTDHNSAKFSQHHKSLTRVSPPSTASPPVHGASFSTEQSAQVGSRTIGANNEPLYFTTETAPEVQRVQYSYSTDPSGYSNYAIPYHHQRAGQYSSDSGMQKEVKQEDVNIVSPRSVQKQDQPFASLEIRGGIPGKTAPRFNTSLVFGNGMDELTSPEPFVLPSAEYDDSLGSENMPKPLPMFDNVRIPSDALFFSNDTLVSNDTIDSLKEPAKDDNFGNYSTKYLDLMTYPFNDDGQEFFDFSTAANDEPFSWTV